VWLGSGVTPERLPDLRRHADGAIVGTWLHRDGRIDQPIDPERVKALVSAA
jgi:predicted TIM-barrel enzyme